MSLPRALSVCKLASQGMISSGEIEQTHASECDENFVCRGNGRLHALHCVGSTNYQRAFTNTTSLLDHGTA